MTRLTMDNLQVSYGKKVVLNDISLSVDEGDMMALLGPSGCGKTTLLNALCGFIPVSHGEIWLGERPVTHLPPDKRNITMVFQSYALWPHMSVGQNIAYGLKIRQRPVAEITRRVAELLDIVGLPGREQERVTALSGGQRQRVALARALAIEPDVLVLDEPLSNLDAKVRLQVRHEIKALQRRLGFTALIVTHDQEEAMVMAERIAVLNQGGIEQVGSPETIYHRPNSPFVADFMGADNHLVWNDSCGCYPLYFRSDAARLSAVAAPSSVSSLTDAGLTLSGTVRQSAFFGNHYRLSIQCAEHVISACHSHRIPEQTPVMLTVPAEALHRFTGSEYRRSSTSIPQC